MDEYSMHYRPASGLYFVLPPGQPVPVGRPFGEGEFVWQGTNVDAARAECTRRNAEAADTLCTVRLFHYLDRPSRRRQRQPFQTERVDGLVPALDLARREWEDHHCDVWVEVLDADGTKVLALFPLGT